MNKSEMGAVPVTEVQRSVIRGCISDHSYLGDVLTYVKQQSPSWETNRFSASQEIPRNS
jgi:hypothetical protein